MTEEERFRASLIEEAAVRQKSRDPNERMRGRFLASVLVPFVDFAGGEYEKSSTPSQVLTTVLRGFAGCAALLVLLVGPKDKRGRDALVDTMIGIFSTELDDAVAIQSGETPGNRSIN
jgi:hypothetical protein